MRFYGPMGFARRSVVCSAQGSLSLYHATVSPHTPCTYPTQTHIYMCIYVRYVQCVTPVRERSARDAAPRCGKVPTESREESKRRPCPLQTSGTSSSCFSPGSSRLYSDSLFLSFLSPFSETRPSAGSFDWRMRTGGEKKE